MVFTVLLTMVVTVMFAVMFKVALTVDCGDDATRDDGDADRKHKTCDDVLVHLGPGRIEDAQSEDGDGDQTGPNNGAGGLGAGYGHLRWCADDKTVGVDTFECTNTDWQVDDVIRAGLDQVKFADVADAAGVRRAGNYDQVGEGVSAAWADHDADGDLDLVVSSRKSVQLFQNEGVASAWKTTGGTAPEGTPCTFPFVFDGVTYNECMWAEQSVAAASIYGESSNGPPPPSHYAVV